MEEKMTARELGFDKETRTMEETLKSPVGLTHLTGSEEAEVIDQTILRILSLYDHLTPLQLWYELGEDHSVRERLTEPEILDRLESLREQGIVETVTKAQGGGHSGYLGYRITGMLGNK